MKQALAAATQTVLKFDQSKFAQHRAKLGRDAGNLIDLRRGSGLTQSKFAAAIGVSRGALANWENDRQRVPAKLAALASKVMRRIDWGHKVTSVDVGGTGITVWTAGGRQSDGFEAFSLNHLARDKTGKGYRYS